LLALMKLSIPPNKDRADPRCLPDGAAFNA